ncbi:MAG: autophagy protein 17 [Alyxoria varia]|nr:MAG: autophagy protein 17 [Alyxoria varia]
MPQPGDDRSDTSSDDGSADEEPSFASLVSHFVAAKRSLSSTGHVWRANEIVAIAKPCLENIVHMDARMGFLDGMIEKHLRHLDNIRHGLETIKINVDEEFKEYLKYLDNEHIQVKEITDTLRSTIVEDSLQIKPGESSLLDFVNEGGVEEQMGMLRECIDHVNEAQRDFDESNTTFDRDLEQIHDKLEMARSSGEDCDFTKTTTLFRSLEAHATEMADLLQSLVRHYDLCVSALKNTEGGGDAVQQAERELPDDLAAFSNERAESPQSLTDEERVELIRVVDKDAGEVNDVVNEIAARSSEMEAQLVGITGQESILKDSSFASKEAINLIESIEKSLPQFINASSVFDSRWHEIKQRIDEKMAELKGMYDFFADFLTAYDGLLVEISRRKASRSKMEKIAREAISKINDLYDVEVERREAFRSEHGEFLPRNLWSGVDHSPAKFDLQIRDKDEDRIPEVSREAVQRAIARSFKSK